MELQSRKMLKLFHQWMNKFRLVLRYEFLAPFGTKHTVFGKIFGYDWMIWYWSFFYDFQSNLQISSGSSQTNFWLLCTYEGPNKLFGYFCVTIIVLMSSLQVPSRKFKTSFWLLFIFEVQILQKKNDNKIIDH
jgi:hypothetical protein